MTPPVSYAFAVLYFNRFLGQARVLLLLLFFFFEEEHNLSGAWCESRSLVYTDVYCNNSLTWEYRSYVSKLIQ